VVINASIATEPVPGPILNRKQQRPDMKKIETGRVCAVCGKTTSPSGQKDTYGFGTTLRRHGIVGRDKAHRDCVSHLGKNQHVAEPMRSIINAFAP
jgi:hypothetical protein